MARFDGLRCLPNPRECWCLSGHICHVTAGWAIRSDIGRSYSCCCHYFFDRSAIVGRAAVRHAAINSKTRYGIIIATMSVAECLRRSQQARWRQRAVVRQLLSDPHDPPSPRTGYS